MLSTWGPPAAMAAAAAVAAVLLYGYTARRRRRAATPAITQPPSDDAEPATPATEKKTDTPEEVAAPVAEVPDPRSFVSETPAELVAQYEVLESDERFQRLYGDKWITAEVVAMSVATDTEAGGKIVTVTCASKDMGFPVVIAHFSPSWEQKLSMLGSGDRIKVCGQIETVSASGVILRNCERLSD